jgi:hypothetical protein
MPISTNLEQQFSSLSTAENQDKVTRVPVVSPTKSELNASVFSASDDEASQGSTDGVNMLVRKTEHKLLEEQGMLDDEPLLKPNPYRFVLFPIQDNDVGQHALQNLPPTFLSSPILFLCWTLAVGNVQKGRGFLLDFGRD